MIEKCADPFDHASELESSFRELSLSEARRKLKPEQEQNEDGTWPVLYCVDCDDEIPEARLAMGKIRCVDCQSNLERKSKMFGGG